MIPQETIDQILSRSDLVDIVSEVVHVSKRGNVYWACCPFHKEKTPSFKIDPQLGLYYCFGCKKTGNVISFVKETVNTDYVGAIRWLADRVGITIIETNDRGTPEQIEQKRTWRETCKRLLADVAMWYHKNLLTRPDAQVARNYIQARELDDASVRQFQLGYSPDGWDGVINWAQKQGYTVQQLADVGIVYIPDNGRSPYDRFRGRLTFPIWDEMGNVVGFSARILVTPNPASLRPGEKQPGKYVNTPETEFFHKGRILYGLNFARKAFKEHGRAIICEGQLDTIACHRAGFANTVAGEGTAFTENHAKMLKRSTQNVTLAYDADTAGQKATYKACKLLHAEGLAVDVVTFPQGDDPDGVFRRGKAEALGAILNHRRPAMEYLLESLCAQYDAASPQGVGQIVQEMLQLIRVIPDPVVRARHCQWLASSLHLPENTIMDALQRVESQETRIGRYQENRGEDVRMAAGNGGQSASSSSGVGKSGMQPFGPVKEVSPLASVIECLLSIALRYREAAEYLSSNSELPGWLPDTPLGQAFNQVLGDVELCEWELAQEHLATSALSEDLGVGRALMTNAYDSWLPNPVSSDGVPESSDSLASKRAAMLRAVDDCLQRLRLESLSEQIQSARQALRSASPEDQSAIQKQLSELIMQKQSLRAGRGARRR